MVSLAKCMVNVADARSRAKKYFDAHYRVWATEFLLEQLGQSGVSSCVGAGCGQAPKLAISLHPPTERQAIEAGKNASAWVAEWRNAPVARYVLWSRKEWSRIGAQDVPERVVLEDVESIATFAGRFQFWKRVGSRMNDLAGRLCACWGARLKTCDAAELAAAVKRSMTALADLEDDDWLVALLVLDWLAGHQSEYVYVRQLPIRGIDTKWLETHRSSIEPLYRVLSGCPLPFMKPPAQIRIRILDEELAPYGLRGISVLPDEPSTFPCKPDLVIVSENLVTTLALPGMRRAIAIHGGGYAVGSLGEVSWLADVRMLYWGDLDVDGFSILNRIRCHFPHVESVLMDKGTLEAHRDLCVPDPNFKRNVTLGYLTKEERSTLDVLLSTDPSLRLEQERVGWDYALGAIAQALEGSGD